MYMYDIQYTCTCTCILYIIHVHVHVHVLNTFADLNSMCSVYSTTCTLCI